MLSWTQATLSRGYDELQDQWGASREPVPGSYRGLTWSVQLALSSEGWEGGGGGRGRLLVQECRAGAGGCRVDRVGGRGG